MLQGFGASTVFLEESPGLMSTQRNRLFSQLSGQDDSNLNWWTEDQMKADTKKLLHTSNFHLLAWATL